MARLTRQAMPALVAVERLERSFADEQSGFRGYLLTGRPELLEQFRAAGRSVAEQEGVLRDALSGVPEVSGQLDVVLRAHRAWLDVAAPAVEARVQGRLAELAVGSEVPRSAELRAEVGDLRRAAEQVTAADAAAARALWSVLTWTLVGAAVAAVLGVVLAVAVLRRSVTRPLAALVDAAERVADGDLEQPVPARGPAEVAAVGGAVERMRVLLNGQHPATEEGTAAGAAVAPPELAVRVADVLDRASDPLGIRPDLKVDNAAGHEVAEPAAGELIAVLDSAVTGLLDTRARLDSLQVELSVTAEEASLIVTVSGVVPGEWTGDMRVAARRWPGTCRIIDLDPDLTVVEWVVALERREV